ncbi:hypothetical protein [Bosea sp. (in: a-proteobacteria)]|jgi:hypothetical protein|uniref:hypothetical protein n=1 Tax=Bosea sp. (in: a-proteobacteria) TaxID=1871050 RepID=UPI0025BFA1E0|nr:hypothetical protein [Bosea sp. (in: a-proteobacteria)]MBR3191600.1 hypothetical protein [Bosea sp. (in: a-proteobacteria)]
MKTPPGLVIAAALASLAPALAQAPGKAVASTAVQKEFEDFIAKFRAALKANDPATVAAMTKLPYMGDASIADAAQFRAKVWPSDFNAKNRACLQRTKPVYDRDGARNEVYAIACGGSIFTFTRTSAGFQLTDVDIAD